MSDDIRCLIGVEDETGNVLGRGPVPMETASDASASDQEASLPRAALHDRDASVAFFSGTNPPTNFRIRQDTNLLADCGVTGVGTLHEMNGATALIGSGAWTIDEVNDADEATKIHQDVLVSPDELHRFELATAAAPGAGVAIKNLTNGRWLVAGEASLDHSDAGFDYWYAPLASTAWQDADPGQYGLHHYGSGGESYTVDLQVESQVLCKGQRKAVLRVYLITTPPNQPPVITIPFSETSIGGGEAQSFSHLYGTAISIADPDDGGAVEQLQVTVVNGTLYLDSTSGLTFVAGENGSSAFTVQGTLAAINAALDAGPGALFLPEPESDTTSTITLVADDLGNTGSGGPMTDTKVITINVGGIAG